MIDRSALLDRVLAEFKKREPHLVASHIQQFAGPEVAQSLGCGASKLEKLECAKLLDGYAKRRGYSAGYELGWHWLSKDEDQLRDWQLAHLEQVGDALGDRHSYFAENHINRSRLGYNFRLAR